jgi:hypothetical protein
MPATSTFHYLFVFLAAALVAVAGLIWSDIRNAEIKKESSDSSASAIRSKDLGLLERINNQLKRAQLEKDRFRNFSRKEVLKVVYYFSIFALPLLFVAAIVSGDELLGFMGVVHVLGVTAMALPNLRQFLRVDHFSLSCTFFFPAVCLLLLVFGMQKSMPVNVFVGMIFVILQGMTVSTCLVSMYYLVDRTPRWRWVKATIALLSCTILAPSGPVLSSLSHIFVFNSLSRRANLVTWTQAVRGTQAHTRDCEYVYRVLSQMRFAAFHTRALGNIT